MKFKISRSIFFKTLSHLQGIVDKKNYNKIISKIYGNYGRILAEYPFLKAFRNNNLNKFIEIEGLENLNLSLIHI